jgi:tetratricopeptide (TPR) repeat protein
MALFDWWNKKDSQKPAEAAQKPASGEPTRASKADKLWAEGARLLEIGSTRRAVEVMHKAMKLEPSRLEGRLNLGAAQFLSKRYDEAVSHLRYVLAFEPQNAVALLNIAACYDALGQPDDAIASLEQLVRERPTWRDAHYNLGVAFYKQKRYDEATQALRAELRLNPQNQNARDLLDKINLLPSRTLAEAREKQATNTPAEPQP